MSCDTCAWGTSQPRVGQAECIAVDGAGTNPALAPFSNVQEAHEKEKVASEAIENAALLKVLASLKGEVRGLKDELADAHASAAVPLKNELSQSVRL